MEQTTREHENVSATPPPQAGNNGEPVDVPQICSLIDVDIAPSGPGDLTETLTPIRLSAPGEENMDQTDNKQQEAEPIHEVVERPCDKSEIPSLNCAKQAIQCTTETIIDGHSNVDAQEELKRLKLEQGELDELVAKMKTKLDGNVVELEKEVQRRVELEQRFTEEAKRTTDQIEELIGKSDSDDTKLAELKKKFDQYTRETSAMIERFTTDRELLTSQLLELRRENDYLRGKYLSKARDLQSADIDLPQSVEELQFHCLTLNEKLILTTLAKERLEETLVQTSTVLNLPTTAVATSASATAPTTTTTSRT